METSSRNSLLFYIAAEVADATSEFVNTERIVLDYLRGTSEKIVGLAKASQEYQSAFANFKQQVQRPQFVPRRRQPGN